MKNIILVFPSKVSGREINIIKEPSINTDLVFSTFANILYSIDPIMPETEKATVILLTTEALFEMSFMQTTDIIPNMPLAHPRKKFGK